MRIELHDRQSEAFKTPATEILYGGAAGGGKSHYLRVSGLRWCTEIPGLQSYLFRRTMPDLRRNHLQGTGSLTLMLRPLMKSGHVKYSKQDNTFTFWNGSVLNLCHCEHLGDEENYQGAEIHVLLMDELTHFDESQYRFLRTRVRMADLDVPAEHRDRLPRIECASNPGSRGHAWVKRTFVAPKAPGEIWRTPEEEGAMLRQFIPAKLKDNPTLMAADPHYVHKLTGGKNEAMVRAFRDGDWDIVAGQAFEMFRRDRHVIEPFEIPRWWTRFRSMDWGSSKPFSVGWWAVSDGSIPGIPADALVRYREWYGWTGQPDEGLRLDSTQVAIGIREREEEQEVIQFSVCDPQCFATHDGPSVAEHMAGQGIYFRLQNMRNARINARRNGFQEVRERLNGVDDVPMLFVFENCRDGFIRTIPDLVTSANDPEDIDTTQEDHCYDEVRYACMSRPWRSAATASQVKKRDRWAEAFARSEQPDRSWMTV